jgi:hypothetical protein
MAMSSKLIVAFAGVALLSACQTDPLPQAGSMDSALGEATKYNAAVQIINPDPVYTAQDAQPGDNGQKMATAVKRYRTDQVKQPVSVSTTSQSGGGSGGSGSGSGPK